MADNVAITPGTGATVAADLIGGALYQRFKLALGADGTAVDAGAGSGAAGTDTQRVLLATDDPAVTILTALQKAEDAAHSTGDKGIQALAVHKDTAVALGADGDYTPLITDTNGRLHVIDVTGTTVQFAEDSAHTTADKGIMALAVHKDTAAALGADGDYTPLLTDTNGRLHVIDPSTTTIAALSKAEDAAHSSGDTGIVSLRRRKDAPAPSSATDADYVTADVSANGRAWVEDPRIVVSVTPTIDTGIFAAGDAVGAKQVLTAACLVAGGYTELNSIVVVDKANQKPVLDILFFDADPSVATITNNAAFVWSTDISKFIGRVRIAAADYQTIDSIAVATVLPAALRELILKSAATTTIWAAVVLVSGTPTFASTTDLIFKYGFKQK